jgi:hypothetical protein
MAEQRVTLDLTVDDLRHAVETVRVWVEGRGESPREGRVVVRTVVEVRVRVGDGRAVEGQAVRRRSSTIGQGDDRLACRVATEAERALNSRSGGRQAVEGVACGVVRIEGRPDERAA